MIVLLDDYTRGNAALHGGALKIANIEDGLVFVVVELHLPSFRRVDVKLRGKQERGPGQFPQIREMHSASCQAYEERQWILSPASHSWSSPRPSTASAGS